MDSTKDVIKNLIEGITKQIDEENEQDMSKIIEKLNASKVKIENAEEFSLLLVYKLKEYLRTIAKNYHEQPKIKNKYKADFIFINYDFLEHNIRQLCTMREGSTCCADKSRHILKMYLQYCIDGTIPDFDASIENYYSPNFGDNQMWIDFCDGLYNLYYGDTKQYFIAYSALVKCEIRKFKHTIHHWHILYNNGEDVEFNYSWDDRDKVDNVLFEDKNNKDYYILNKKYIGTNNFEKYALESEDDFLHRHSYKVPKSAIKKIYSVDEEKEV